MDGGRKAEGVGSFQLKLKTRWSFNEIESDIMTFDLAKSLKENKLLKWHLLKGRMKFVF